MLKTREEIKQIARQCIIQEKEAVENLLNHIDEQFISCIEEIYHNDAGRVIVCGIGKSANIAQKIVATFNSTGTPAIFMHAADAIHGDLGIIQKNDIVMCLSKSGNTPEITLLVPMIKMLGSKVVAIVGNVNSYLAKNADYVINCTVSQEACPNNLAPTASSTAQLVTGDAMAVCLIAMRGFSSEDFARIHPGGTLGKRLYLKVEQLCKTNEVPQVSSHADLNTIIYEISSKRLGVTAVIDNGEISGIITDGDLRRMLEKNANPQQIMASDIMSKNPKTIDIQNLAVNALEIMRNNNITSILVTEKGKYAGIIHLHDLLKEGII
ncbi:MAG: KpsF/GutQ family sugar-phosphate isomerase [Bacteroidales bacterium]|jgi:arabinose-5-phosphate isomerase|nr:KpsF/GutQ family sugar-phosphate isomerase [Bacteroidales bacterium]